MTKPLRDRLWTTSRRRLRRVAVEGCASVDRSHRRHASLFEKKQARAGKGRGVVWSKAVVASASMYG